MDKVDAMRVCPHTEIVEDRRMKLRKLQVDPSVLKLSILHAEPNCAALKTEAVDPMRM